MPTHNGLPCCTCLDAWLPAFEAELARYGIKVRFTQLRGAYGPSAGTHKDGAFDLVVTVRGVHTTDAAYKIVVKVARQMGADATWERPWNWDRRGGIRHIHGLLTGCPHLAWQAKAQQVAVKAGRNGLANNGRDTGPRPLSKRTWREGIAWAKAHQKPKTSLRFATYNLPAADKIANTAARIKAAVALMRGAPPAFIGWQELEGIKRPRVASDFAHDVDAALGSNWRLVKPTARYNENYISYDGRLLSLVHQYDDSILEAKTGGRHLTRAVFKVKKTGQLVAVGNTHLVNGDSAAHERDRQAQAADALKSMRAVSAKHGGCPIIIVGDMNTPKPLKALVGAGMKLTRKYADDTTTRNHATYTNYAKDTPSKDPDWIIDQAYVSKDVYCVGYTVRQNTARGKYAKPRPSDHDPVVSSVLID